MLVRPNALELRHRSRRLGVWEHRQTLDSRGRVHCEGTPVARMELLTR